MPIEADGIPIPTTRDTIPKTLEETFQEPQLDIQRMEQIEDAWCYAACAQMSIGHVTGKAVQQCAIASFAKGDNCCNSTASICTSSGCGKDQIEGILANWEVRSEVGGPIDILEVNNDIFVGRPIEVVIDWNNVPQSSHNVLITGVDFADDYVYVIDPLPGINNTGWVRHQELSDGFGNGRWDMTWRKLEDTGV